MLGVGAILYIVGLVIYEYFMVRGEGIEGGATVYTKAKEASSHLFYLFYHTPIRKMNGYQSETKKVFNGSNT